MRLMNGGPAPRPVPSPGPSPPGAASSSSRATTVSPPWHPHAVAGRAGTAPRRSPGLCEMTEKLPERLATAEGVLQPGAVVQLQGDADLRSEARSEGEEAAAVPPGPTQVWRNQPLRVRAARAHCAFQHRELPGVGAVCHGATRTNAPRFLNFF